MKRCLVIVTICLFFLSTAAAQGIYTGILADEVLKADPAMASELLWAEVDLDTNGTPQLLIYRPLKDRLDVLCAWTAENGSPIELVRSSETIAYTLTYGDIKGWHLVMEEAAAPEKTGWAFWQLKGHTLILNDALIRDFSISNVEPWLYTADTSWDEASAFPVTAAEATSMLSGYLHCAELENSHPLLSAQQQQ